MCHLESSFVFILWNVRTLQHVIWFKMNDELCFVMWAQVGLNAAVLLCKVLVVNPFTPQRKGTQSQLTLFRHVWIRHSRLQSKNISVRFKSALKPILRACVCMFVSFVSLWWFGILSSFPTTPNRAKQVKENGWGRETEFWWSS